MADHVRSQLRAAVESALTGLPTTAANVFTARSLTLVDTELPCLLIYVTSETTQPFTIHDPVVVDRTVDIDVQGVAKASSALDDVLDRIAKEVEAVLASGVIVGSKRILLDYQGCEMEFDAKAEKPVGSITLHYQAEIFNLASAPDVLV